MVPPRQEFRAGGQGRVEAPVCGGDDGETFGARDWRKRRSCLDKPILHGRGRLVSRLQVIQSKPSTSRSRGELSSVPPATRVNGRPPGLAFRNANSKRVKISRRPRESRQAFRLKSSSSRTGTRVSWTLATTENGCFTNSLAISIAQAQLPGHSQNERDTGSEEGHGGGCARHTSSLANRGDNGRLDAGDSGERAVHHQFDQRRVAWKCGFKAEQGGGKRRCRRESPNAYFAFDTKRHQITERREFSASGICLIYMGLLGGPDRDRTDDLFHAMEARSQLRHRPTRFILRQRVGFRQCDGNLGGAGGV